MPVEVKHDVTPAERLLYQLQSEGAELEPWEKYNAWNRLWKLKFGLGEKDIIKVGEILLGNGKGDTFRRKVQEFNYAIKLEDEMREKGVIGPRSEGPSKTNLGLMSKIGVEKDPELRLKLGKKL